MSERLRSASRSLLLGVPLFAVALAGCGGHDGATPADKNKKAAEEAPSFKAIYLPNGNRKLLNFHTDQGYATILQTCDGIDLLEQSEMNGADNGQAGNAIERSVAHPACADGKLTPEDFRKPS